MKKHFVALLLTLTMAFSMTACGNKDTTTSESQEKEENTTNRPVSQYDNSTLEGILTGIETDFSDSIKFLQDSYAELNTTIGETYEGYLENKQSLTDWYELVLSEETALFGRTKERAIEYMKLISSSIAHDKEGTISDAMDEFYDRIYDGAMDDFYDDIYDDLMGDAYDDYYDGVVEDGYDVEPYDKWYEESSAAYDEWYNTSSTIYNAWYDTNSTLYQYWYHVNSGFYSGNFDIDAIIAEYEKAKAEEEAKENESSEEIQNTEEDVNVDETSENIRPEFQEAMDGYEAFFDEYVEFMNEYASADADDMLDMMDDYSDYMKQYVEPMEKFEELESSDMSTEEALYYAEVSSRIYAKVLEIEY